MEQKLRTHRVSQFLGLLPSVQEGAVANFGIAHTLRWVSEKTGYTFTDQERSEPAFLVQKPNFSIEAISLSAEGQGHLWMLQFKHPDSKIKTREWVTEIAIGTNADQKTHFGVRLNYRDTTAIVQNNIFSVPGVLRKITEVPGLNMDGVSISPKPREINDYEDLESFFTLAELPNRTLPIVMVTESYDDGYILNAENLAFRLEGVAHVFKIPHGFTFPITDKWGRPSSAYGGAARILVPSKDIIAAGENREHQLFLPSPNGHQNTRAIETQIIQHAFKANLARLIPEKEFPSFASLKKVFYYQATRSLQEERAAKSRQVRETDTTVPPAVPVETILAEREASLERERKMLEKLRAASEEEVRTALSMAEEVEANLRAAEAENKTLLDQVAAMTAELDALKNAKPVVTRAEISSLFPPLSEVQRWAQEAFPEELLITRRAAKAALGSVYADPDLVYKALILLARQKRNMLIYTELTKGGQSRDLRGEFATRARELHLEDGISINRPSAAQFGETYFVTHEGERFFLDRHLRRGGTRDPRRCFRLYYTYDAATERIVVGHLPSHLENSLT